MEKFDFEEVKLRKEEENLIKELQENLARGGTSGVIVCWCEK